jgi:sigma-B regulation protein RsbU (phosphoserine phosphatase)
MTLFRSLVRASANLTYFTGQVPLLAEVQPPAAAADDSAILQNTITLTNNYVARTHHRASMFASIFLGVLNPMTGSLTYVNGGHEAPLILGPAGIKTSLMPTGPVVGIFPDINFVIKETQFEIGDTLYIFTDGVTDAQNSLGDMFTKESLLSLLGRPVSSAAGLVDSLKTSLHNHVAGANQYDDITMMAVRRVPEAIL